MDKYDRQIRLWGQFGQQNLNNTNVLVLGCQPAGIEALKNLVLPGINGFCIVDDNKASSYDSQNNFFIKKQDIGQYRSQIVCQKMMKINGQVDGQYLSISVDQFMDQNNTQNSSIDKNSIADMNRYQVVIANELCQQKQLEIEKMCIDRKIKLVIVYSIGLIGYIRLSMADHLVYQKKQTEVDNYDLRLFNGFQQLDDYVSEFQLDQLEDYEYSHVPYLIILYKLFREQKQDGQIPSTFQQKQQFRQKIVSECRNYQDNVSYQEAYQNVWRIYNRADQANDAIRSIFERIGDIEQFQKDGLITSQFWRLAAALKQYYQQYQELPINGDIPDMNALTVYYTRLKDCYVQRYRQNRQWFVEILEKQREMNKQGMIDQQLVDYFLKNCQEIEWMKYRTLEEEVTKGAEVQGWYENDNYKWYWAIQAAMSFETKYNRKPTIADGNDSGVLYTMMKELIDGRARKEQGVELEVEQKYITELCRQDGKHFGVAGAMLGGIVAQEVIKLVSHIFMPINSTCIWDGVQMTTAIYNM